MRQVLLFGMIYFIACDISCALVSLEHQLTLFAQSEPSAYREYCRHRPRFLKNVTGICYLNAAMTFLHKLFCHRALRDFARKKPAPDPQDRDLFSEIYRKFYVILENYDNAKIGDIAFAEEYHTFATYLTSQNVFDACGGWTYDVLKNLLTLVVKNDPQFPVTFVECSNHKVGVGGTLLEQYMRFALAHGGRYDITFPSLVCIIPPLSLIQKLYAPWKSAEAVYLLDAGFTFPEIFDLTPYYGLQHVAPVYYRLSCVVVERPGHAFAIVRHGSLWYWCNDTTVAILPDDELRRAAQSGQFFLPADSRAQALLDNAVVNVQTTSDDGAIPCIFLYERAD